MRLSDFSYELPDDLIARYPPANRRDSRLLAINVDRADIVDRQFAELPTLLRKDDLLVLNDTKVIPARLVGHKESGGKVEVLIERVLNDTSALALVRASKSPKAGTKLVLPQGMTAMVAGRKDDLFELNFESDVLSYLDAFGEVPLPPYLGRDAEEADRERYQCVYAEAPGAVAAPTAGLHFDQAMLAQLQQAGIRCCTVTLHVGAGTFQSLRAEQLEENRLHSERVQVSGTVCDAVAQTRANGGRVIAIGTTSVRALESASASGELQPLDGNTELFIYPGYRFRSVDAMLTNFHLPESSLLMLVAAFAGTDLTMRAYEHAVQTGYRFFSYGDAMLLERSHAI